MTTNGNQPEKGSCYTKKGRVVVPAVAITDTNGTTHNEALIALARTVAAQLPPGLNALILSLTDAVEAQYQFIPRLLWSIHEDLKLMYGQVKNEAMFDDIVAKRRTSETDEWDLSPKRPKHAPSQAEKLALISLSDHSGGFSEEALLPSDVRDALKGLSEDQIIQFVSAARAAGVKKRKSA